MVTWLTILHGKSSCNSRLCQIIFNQKQWQKERVSGVIRDNYPSHIQHHTKGISRWEIDRQSADHCISFHGTDGDGGELGISRVNFKIEKKKWKKKCWHDTMVGSVFFVIFFQAESTFFVIIFQAESKPGKLSFRIEQDHFNGILM